MRPRFVAGTLPMWEALRLNDRLGSGPVVHNVLNVEAAIWREAFEPEENLVYNVAGSSSADGEYFANGAGDEVIYSIDDQKRMSWRFWFRQMDVINGIDQERDIRNTFATGGHFFNSYNPTDFALELMQVNDWALRNHYSPAIGNYRTLSGGGTSMQSMAALMQQRIAFGGPETFNHPAGAAPLQFARDNNLDNNIDARDFGWNQTSHGHFLYSDRDNDASLPTIWSWYDEVFAARQFTSLGNLT